MRYLVDTHAFLWWMLDESRLSIRIKRLFDDAEAEFYLSAISAWEIMHKHCRGRLVLPDASEQFIDDACARYGIESLPFEAAAAMHLRQLPAIHKDPFDRMLICQAMHHGLAILTDDRHIARYPVQTIW